MNAQYMLSFYTYIPGWSLIQYHTEYLEYKNMYAYIINIYVS